MTIENSEVKETARLETFSDAVFAIAITLLVLDLKLPSVGSGSLIQELQNQWPSFFAFITSFMTTLVMWVNHHYMFNYIKKVDPRLMFLNGFVLLFVAITPFTTSLVAQNILSSDAKTAAVVYSGGFLLLAVAWNILWRYASSGRKLLGKGMLDEYVKAISFRCNIGITLYSLALVVSYFDGLAGVGAIVTISGFWAVTAALGR